MISKREAPMRLPEIDRDLGPKPSFRTTISLRLFVPIAIGTMILGGMFGAFGILLVYMGAKGASNIKMFGQNIETADVGVASIFIGALVVIIIIREVLKNAERLSRQKRTDWALAERYAERQREYENKSGGAETGQ